MQLIDYSQLTPAQRGQLLEIQLPSEQQCFAGDIADALYLLLGCGSDQRRGVALLLDDVPRAFLLLQRGAFLPAWGQPDAAMMTALQVDRRFQGQGLGRFCMQALPALLRTMWPDLRRLQLSVDRANLGALALYRATGWRESGNGFRARVGYEQQMSLLLAGSTFDRCG